MSVPATQCLREDEVECEEAVKFLTQCCPDVVFSAVQCTYSDLCGISYPDLSPSESLCILDQRCEALRAGNICKRVEERSENTPDPTTGSPAGDEVCP